NRYEKAPAAAALGKRFFFDPRFSRNGAVSCSSCHDPNQHFQDGRPLAQGIGLAMRRTPSIVGAGHSPWQFWDGRKDSLWSQALAPVEDALEHGSNRSRVVELIQRHYRRDYEAVFGKMPDLIFAEHPADAGPLGDARERSAWLAKDDMTRDKISRVFANFGKAIAAFEKTLVLKESRFDRYVADTLAEKKSSALTDDEIAGLRIFVGKGRCVTCHAGPLFTDHHFHSTRVPERDPTNPDQGRAAAIKKIQVDEFNCLGRFSDASPAQCEELRYMVTNDPATVRAFKTPGLRNVALRPPYMHAGQLATLRDVVRHYVQAPEAALGPDGMVHKLGMNSELLPLPLTETEIDNLVRFLGALSAEADIPPGSRQH
ncbi:MAG: cytochrome c peroxidase, partial [Usitatibacteraceae bacterium]